MLVKRKAARVDQTGRLNLPLITRRDVMSTCRVVQYDEKDACELTQLQEISWDNRRSAPHDQAISVSCTAVLPVPVGPEVTALSSIKVNVIDNDVSVFR